MRGRRYAEYTVSTTQRHEARPRSRVGGVVGRAVAVRMRLFRVKSSALRHRHRPLPLRPRQRHHRPDSHWRSDDRQRHPKHYLGYLTNARLDGKARYEETTHGKAALADLDWPAIVRLDGRTPAVKRFARSLIADLVDMLGPCPVHPELALLEPADCHALTWPPPQGRVLRNL